MSFAVAEVPWYTCAAAVMLAIAVAVLARAVSNQHQGNRPPIFEEIPFIGGLFGFMKSPTDLAARGFHALGEVFTIPMLHKRFTFIIGPNVNPRFFTARDDHLSYKEVFSFMTPLLGDDVGYCVDEVTRAEQTQLIHSALKSHKMHAYVPEVVREARDFFGKWGEAGIVDLHEQFHNLVLYTASSTLMGKEVRENMFEEEVFELFRYLAQGAQQPISLLAPRLPTPTHKRRDAARKRFGDIFHDIVLKRRASGVKGNDFLQTLIDGSYSRAQGGRPLTESEITGLLVTTLFAGVYPSVITCTWTGLFLATNPHAWDACIEEQRQIIKEHGEDLNVEILDKMVVLHACVKEALRLRPPLIMIPRYARQPLIVTDSKGREFYVPKGDVCLAAPTVQHRSPRLFTNPDKYDYERFLPPRCEDQASKFTFIGFGGGRHQCIGATFGLLQIKTIWSHVLRNFDFEVLDTVPEPHESLNVVPEPWRVKFTRKEPLKA